MPKKPTMHPRAREHAIANASVHLFHARRLLVEAEANNAADAVRRAIKSTEGALRHAGLRADRAESPRPIAPAVALVPVLQDIQNPRNRFAVRRGSYVRVVDTFDQQDTNGQACIVFDASKLGRWYCTRRSADGGHVERWGYLTEAQKAIVVRELS